MDAKDLYASQPSNGWFVGSDGKVKNIDQLGLGGGVAPTVTVGETTTGQPGTDAAVKNSGTETDLVLVFTIPRGADGATGSAGPAGADGAAGPAGPQGPTGADGAVITVISLTRENGEFTGGTATLSNGATVPVIITDSE